MRVRKHAQGDEKWTTTSRFIFFSYWYTYLQTSNFLLPFLPALTENGYTVTDTFHFTEEMCKQDPNLFDCNWTRTHNHFVHKRTLNHLVKLAK